MKTLRRHWQEGIAGFVILNLLFVSCPGETAEGGWRKIPPKALSEMMARGEHPILINTMGLIECLDHSIMGSLCIPSEEFAGRIGELPSANRRPLVLYCESDAALKSCEAADVAVRQGYSSVYVLEGGMPAWKAAGYDTISMARIPRRAIPSVKPSALRRRLTEKRNLLLVDIRSESAFQQDHIKGAVNLPMYQLHIRWRELPLDRPLIVVDKRGFRSPLAASYLMNKGFAVEPLFGGIEAWKAMLAKESKDSAGIRP